jgi:hypothetical protein
VAIEVVPGPPQSGPVLVSQGPTQITVSMPSVTGSLTGGSPLTSYNLQFNKGAAINSYISWIGEVPASLTQIYQKNELSSNLAYKFRCRIANKHGWGPFSTAVTLIAATAPSQVSTPVFSVVSDTKGCLAGA